MDNGSPQPCRQHEGLGNGDAEQHCFRSTRPLQMRSYVRQLPVCRMIELAMSTSDRLLRIVLLGPYRGTPPSPLANRKRGPTALMYRPVSLFCSCQPDAIELPSVWWTEVVDAGFFAGNAHSFIAVDAHRCLFFWRAEDPDSRRGSLEH
jgi:hypothetical protein